MMHVVADTTVYRADSRREKAAFRALSRLACAGHLMLHIPEIVRREFISQERDQYSTNVQALLTEFHHLAKRSLPGAVAEFVAGSIRELASLSADLGNFSEAEFGKWAEQLSATIHPIVESHGARVVEAYFAGTPPFRDPKRRDDFPDAFLWQAVLDLAASHTPLFVISSDKGILKAARGTHDVIPFASLEEFVASEPFQAVLKAHFASTNFKALVTLLPQHLDLISSAIANELVDKLAGQAVRSDQIPDDNSEAMISMVGEPVNLDLEISAAVDHGGALFVVPFSLETECLLDYAIFKADFYALPEDKADSIGTTDLNNHYYSAQENYQIRVRGLLSIEVDAEILKGSDLTEDDLSGILEDATISIDSIEDIEVVQ